METERPDAPWLCLVCGLNLQGFDDPPWGESGVDPSYNFCPCCGVEFGYGDASFDGVRRWRSRWTAAGSEWFDPSVCPEEWELGQQLEALPDRAR